MLLLKLRKDYCYKSNSGLLIREQGIAAVSRAAGVGRRGEKDPFILSIFLVSLAIELINIPTFSTQVYSSHSVNNTMALTYRQCFNYFHQYIDHLAVPTKIDAVFFR